MASDFERQFAEQWPLRPDHPDMQRLLEVVEMVERLKAEGADARQVYEAVVDVYTVSYLGANRMGMNIPSDFPSGLRQKLLELMTNAWVEGVFFGVQYERLGGHRPSAEDAGPVRSG